jgi:hypothetical protein
MRVCVVKLIEFSIAYKSSSFDEVEDAAVNSTDWEIRRDHGSVWKGAAAEAGWILHSSGWVCTQIGTELSRQSQS